MCVIPREKNVQKFYQTNWLCYSPRGKRWERVWVNVVHRQTSAAITNKHTIRKIGKCMLRPKEWERNLIKKRLALSLFSPHKHARTYTHITHNLIIHSENKCNILILTDKLRKYLIIPEIEVAIEQFRQLCCVRVKKADSVYQLSVKGNKKVV